MSGEGVKVLPNQMVTADAAAEVIAPPQAFDRAQYVAALESAQPLFVALVKDDPDAVSKEENIFEKMQEKRRSALKILAFQLGGVGFAQERRAGSVFTGQIAWTPSLRILGPLAIRGHVAMAPMKDRRNFKFNVYEAAPMVSLTLADLLILEAGAGIHKWDRVAPVNKLFMAAAGLKLSEDRFIERLYVGAARHEMMDSRFNTMNELRIGLGFQF
jgi:hypothetical protein